MPAPVMGRSPKCATKMANPIGSGARTCVSYSTMQKKFHKLVLEDLKQQQQQLIAQVQASVNRSGSHSSFKDKEKDVLQLLVGCLVIMGFRTSYRDVRITSVALRICCGEDGKDEQESTQNLDS